MLLQLNYLANSHRILTPLTLNSVLVKAYSFLDTTLLLFMPIVIVIGQIVPPQEDLSQVLVSSLAKVLSHGTQRSNMLSPDPQQRLSIDLWQTALVK